MITKRLGPVILDNGGGVQCKRRDLGDKECGAYIKGSQGKIDLLRQRRDLGDEECGHNPNKYHVIVSRWYCKYKDIYRLPPSSAAELHTLERRSSANCVHTATMLMCAAFSDQAWTCQHLPKFCSRSRWHPPPRTIEENQWSQSQRGRRRRTIQDPAQARARCRQSHRGRRRRTMEDPAQARARVSSLLQRRVDPAQTSRSPTDCGIMLQRRA